MVVLNPTTTCLTIETSVAAAEWLALDIETGDAPEEAVAVALETWTPPANVKDPVKLEARRAEAIQKARERAALLDASPVLCIAAQTERERISFNGMNNEAYSIEDWTVVPCGDERGMLIAFRAWADRSADAGTLLVGHNLRSFDLPKLRARYVHYRLRLPKVLTPKLRDEDWNETVDTMTLYKAFSMEHRDERYIALDTVAAGLGIPRPKEIISGADVPRLHHEGQHHAVLTYCCVDTLTATRAFQLMTSCAPDLD